MTLVLLLVTGWLGLNAVLFVVGTGLLRPEVAADPERARPRVLLPAPRAAADATSRRREREPVGA